jgi:hypothetical protein
MHPTNPWPNRDVALAYLTERQPSRLRVFTQALEHIDSCIEEFERQAPSSPLAKACGITLAKGKNFALSSLGVISDGYGQESGVLLRLLVEHIELLNYLERFPDEATNALANQLPSAGVRAKRVEGKFKFLRDFLNEHSSHGSFSDHSIGHVINRDGTINRVPHFGEETFDTNFRMNAVFTIFLYRAAVSCLQTVNHVAFDVHAGKFDGLLARARYVLPISAEEEA